MWLRTDSLGFIRWTYIRFVQKGCRELSKKYHSIIHFELSYQAILCERVFERQSSRSFGNACRERQISERATFRFHNWRSDQNDSSILTTTRMRMLEDPHNISWRLYLCPSLSRFRLITPTQCETFAILRSMAILEDSMIQAVIKYSMVFIIARKECSTCLFSSFRVQNICSEKHSHPYIFSMSCKFELRAKKTIWVFESSTNLEWSLKMSDFGNFWRDSINLRAVNTGFSIAVAVYRDLLLLLSWLTLPA